MIIFFSDLKFPDLSYPIKNSVITSIGRIFIQLYSEDKIIWSYSINNSFGVITQPAPGLKGA